MDYMYVCLSVCLSLSSCLVDIYFIVLCGSSLFRRPFI